MNREEIEKMIKVSQEKQIKKDTHLFHLFNTITLIFTLSGILLFISVITRIHNLLLFLIIPLLGIYISLFAHCVMIFEKRYIEREAYEYLLNQFNKLKSEINKNYDEQ